MTEFELFNDSGLEIPLAEGDFLKIIGVISEGEGKIFSLVESVYVDEAGIIEVNSKYLRRNYVTDIITFSYSENEPGSLSDNIEGTLYMCSQRISEQSEEFKTTLLDEYTRVFIHGLLHLCGYDDQSEKGKELMTQKENHYLGKLS